MPRTSSTLVFLAAAVTSAIPVLASQAAPGKGRADAPHVIPSVGAMVETPALFDDDAGGNANGDDPAIWVHATNPAASLIIVTKKNAGLSVYDLAGKELQAIARQPRPAPTTVRGASTTSTSCAASSSADGGSISPS